MKKVTAIILALVLVLALTGCDGKDLEEKISSAADRIEAGAESLGDKISSAADRIEAGAENLGDKLSGLGDKLSGASEPEPEPTDAPEPTAEPEGAGEAAPSDGDIRPEIKEAIDTYEEFFREYVDFMKSYDASNIGALSDYLSFLEKYTDYMQKLDDLEDADLNDAETIYLTQATLRIDQMLLEVAG